MSNLVIKNAKINGEITDITVVDGKIAKIGKTLVFVEVKTRTSEFFGSGAEAVDNRKLANIYAALQYYIHKKKLQNLKPRIDVISILLDKNSFSINHIENIEI